MLLNVFIYGFALVLDVKLSVLEVFFFFFWVYIDKVAEGESVR